MSDKLEGLSLWHKQRRILDALEVAFPRFVENFDLVAACYDEVGEAAPESALANLESFCSRMKAPLLAAGAAIECARGQGRRLIVLKPKPIRHPRGARIRRAAA